MRDKKTKRLRDKEWGSQWSIVNGQWSIVNGQWSMVNGQRAMVKETKSGGVGERKSGREEGKVKFVEG